MGGKERAQSLEGRVWPGARSRIMLFMSMSYGDCHLPLPLPLQTPVIRCICCNDGSSASHLPAFVSGVRRESSTLWSVMDASSCTCVSLGSGSSKPHTDCPKQISKLLKSWYMASVRTLALQNRCSRVDPSKSCCRPQIDPLCFESSNRGVYDDAGH